MEATVPLTSVRALLQYFGKKNGILYLINVFFLTVVYFFVRICIFPCVYALYAYQKQLGILEILFSLPILCHIGTIAILAFQSFWFLKLLKTEWGVKLKKV